VLLEMNALPGGEIRKSYILRFRTNAPGGPLVNTHLRTDSELNRITQVPNRWSPGPKDEAIATGFVRGLGSKLLVREWLARMTTPNSDRITFAHHLALETVWTR
jgi:hypothetical protein